MKLFQRLLVAPAALGLMAPIAANAAELNLNGVSDYSESSQSVQNFSDVYPTDWAFKALTDLAESRGCNVSIPSETISRYEAAALLNKCLGSVASELNTQERRLIDEFSAELAVIKGRSSDITAGIGQFEAGQFSSTTTMGGSAVFNVGSVSDGGTDDTNDSMYMQYAYVLELNTSFRGTDSLFVEIETGNASGPFASMDSAVAGSSNALAVSSMFYSFPLGNDFEVTVGPLLDQDDVIASTGSVYSDAFRHSSMRFSAAGDQTGGGAAISYSNDSGFVGSFSYVGVDASNSANNQGLTGSESEDVTTISAGYNADEFGVGIVIASNDGDGLDANGDAVNGFDTFGVGFNYSPEATPVTFSVTYDTIDFEVGEERTDLFFGVEYEAGPGTLGVAYHSLDEDGGSANDETGYEVVYAYPVNDNITVTPGLFYVEDTSTTGDDDTGLFVETTFSF